MQVEHSIFTIYTSWLFHLQYWCVELSYLKLVSSATSGGWFDGGYPSSVVWAGGPVPFPLLHASPPKKTVPHRLVLSTPPRRSCTCTFYVRVEYTVRATELWSHRQQCDGCFWTFITITLVNNLLMLRYNKQPPPAHHSTLKIITLCC